MAGFVGYYRVSTSQQARSGLGLDAQREAVREYVNQVDGDLLFEFTEAESGASAERPQLKEAIRCCRLRRAMLVVAKLDRLARNVNFISELMESGVEFIAADMPDANRLTIHIIAAIAEYERQVISDRTKSALARAKAAGTKLGNPQISALQDVAVSAAKLRANKDAAALLRHVRHHDPDWSLSATALANIFNADGIRGPRGGTWSAASIHNLRRRLTTLGHGPLRAS